ncbi:Ribosome bioproteinsis protein Nop16 [Purpureocillium takamizusanense]|uniref:Nucleolar protein 16 n=1 Tax=Purpureocillium takamizusanense TaxID=2060973 RepID=A0A9Q8QFI4_9HYPO|nr:Ribosome biogenesis protein Nop16 [Purpureocillium takamizusanense]UNI18690.1 Ribosome bioproteinsis protein Nop16 [Purpureocillium takamizusanense]
MGRELQKKKRRAMRQPARPKKPSKKVLNPRGNNVIAQNWDKKETLAQNYRRLGLVARLKAPTGGIEKKLSSVSTATTTRATPNDPFAITTIDKAVVSEARVERDADGKIVRILGRGGDNNPLNDPLAMLDSDDDDLEEMEPTGESAPAAAVNQHGGDEEEWGGIAEQEAHEGQATDVVRSLIAESHNEAPKKARHTSEREREWLERLVARHGDDTRAMARDAKLNPMQQTAADIAKRIKKMQREA